MSNVFAKHNLKPELLWSWFSKICSIPHPSFHEEAIVEFIINWAKENDYFVGQDEVGNILLRKPATPGYENVPSICLQAHVDMVPEANSDKIHDFTKDPITPVIKDDYVYADNTTLGADNGIGLASILAVFEDKTLNHGPLEALLTRTEEVAMIGAKGLAPNWLQSEYMINTDTEEWGHLYLGCAGGCDIIVHKEFEWKNLKDNSKVFQIHLGGFRGGHSGCDIHTDRESAIVYLNKILFAVYQEVKFNPVSYQAGKARNAICREALCELMVTEANIDKFLEVFNRKSAEILSVIENAEKAEITVKEVSSEGKKRLSCSLVPTLLNFLVCVKNGVLRNSDLFADTVETSCSVGVMTLNQEKGLSYEVLARSTNDIANKELADHFKALSDLAGYDIRFKNFYSGWLPVKDKFTDYVTDRYSKFIGQDIDVKVIHAGLECGVIQGHYPNLKMVSLGPDINNPHTPQERVKISSTENYYNLLVDILENFKTVC